MRLKNILTIKAILLFFTASACADVSVTQLPNEGVIISDGVTRIMIDGMVVEPYSIYGGLPPEAVPLFEQAAGPYAEVNLALASHRHHDHNQPRFACQFLQSSPSTKFISSPQVLGLMREKCRQLVTTSPRVIEIEPQYGEHQVIGEGSATITVFPLSHGTRKYARIQNYGHQIDLGGMTVLHIGDAAMNAADFEQAGLEQTEINIALIPFWYFQPGPGADIVNRFMDVPYKIAVHIPPGEMEEVKAHLSENFPDVLVLEPPLKEVTFKEN